MKRCPQCDSLGCGAFACRFSGLSNDAFRSRQALLESIRTADYAEAMIQNDRASTGEASHDLNTRGAPLKVGA